MNATTTSRRAESLRDLEQEVGVMIRRIRRVLWERARAIHPDLQPASYLMLAYLAEHGELRASTLADALVIDKGAVSRQLGHLVELGLVDRTPDPADGRASLLAASDAAVSRINAVVEDRRRWLDEQLGDWTDEELSDFARVLGRYNAALDERA